MYLYSSDENSLKIILSKADAEQLLLNEPSQILRKSIISAIFKAALPKSRFLLSNANVTAKLIELSEGNFILEFRKSMKTNKVLRCYICQNLNEVGEILNKLTVKKAEKCCLYCKKNKYYLLSEKLIYSKAYRTSEHIDAVLEEYAHLISSNAAEEIAGLL